MPRERTRRQVLETLGVGALVGLGGCAGLAGPPGAADDPTTRRTTVTPATTERTTTTATTRTTETTTRETTTDEPTTTETTAEEYEPPDIEGVEAPANGIADAPIPDDPGRHKYATMGPNDAPVQATLYGGWKCPYTRAFVTEFMGDIVDRYVAPGHLQLRFRAVPYRGGEPFHGPDEPRAARAGLAVWYNDPGDFWTYFSYMFTNQRGADGWADRDLLVGMADVAGVEHLRTIDGAIESGAFASQVGQTMDAVERVPIETIPRFTIEGRDGSVPANYREETHTALRSALD